MTTKALLNVPVLCIFFARPEQFARTFATVKKAKPKTLLLWQDGPRSNNPLDEQKVKECREIAKQIDWECNVHKCYHDENMGCDPSTFLAMRWAFSLVDKCIILEDDLVASQSFFKFCEEMLYKYETDERIDRVCGTNLLGRYDIPYDYFFNNVGNSWGWATWRRVAEQWEKDYKFINDEYAVSRMRALQPSLTPHLLWEKECIQHQAEQVPYWEHIIGAQCLLNNRLVIYPSVNMVHNIGLDSNSTHAPAKISELPKSVQSFFKNEAQDLNWPLIHPKYIINDQIFSKLCKNKLEGSIFSQFVTYIERIILKIKKLCSCTA